MTITQAFKAINKDNLSQAWADTRHYAKVFATTLTIGAAMKLGLPSLTVQSGVLTFQATTETLLAVLMLAVAVRALSDWMRG